MKKKVYEKLVRKSSTKTKRDASVKHKRKAKKSATGKEALDPLLYRRKSRKIEHRRARSRDRSRSESPDIGRLETYEEVIVFSNVQTRVFDPQVVFTREEPDKILARVKTYLTKHGYKYRERKRKYKIFMDDRIDEERMVISMKAMKVDRKKYCLKLRKLTGDTMTYWHILDEIGKKILRK
eukprot:TRINITY_DN10279_c0_g1_i1.p1 TRINITY_DN10279_c0_g1~~TRINITY_DN10279_c0_g1_i1.p1  ORF type:complete len:181 (-),score=25.73 TRINITY_DN10279_c0_g1_i1:120-662(-)